MNLHRALIAKSLHVAVASFLLSSAALVSHDARADSAVAEALFKKGLDELNGNNFKAACADFKASDSAEASVGARLNLGKCNEKQGKLASAWSAYKSAVSLARGHDDKRADDANASAAALEGKYSTVKFTMKAPQQGMKITIDGADTGGVLDTDLPVDPGDHNVEVSAPGYVPQTLKLSIGAGVEKKTLDIPALAVDTTGKYSGGAGASGGGGGSGLLVGGIVVGGIGVVGLVVGGAFGGLAISQKSTVKSTVTPAGSMTCVTAQCKNALSSAKTDATVSTAGLIAGGILVAGGAALVIVGVTKGKHSDETKASWTIVPAVTPNAAGAVVAGTF
jgi:hypothetical protein